MERLLAGLQFSPAGSTVVFLAGDAMAEVADDEMIERELKVKSEVTSHVVTGFIQMKIPKEGRVPLQCYITVQCLQLIQQRQSAVFVPKLTHFQIKRVKSSHECIIT